MKKTPLLCVLCLLLLITSFFLVSCGKEEETQETKQAPQSTQYTITWKNEAGVTLTETAVDKGAIPSYTYDKQDTVEWDYTVSGWSTSQNGTVLSSLPAASSDATYFAVVTSLKKQYIVTFNTNGGSEIPPIKRDYGTSVAKPTDPTLEGKKFSGWCTDSALKNAVVWPVTLTENVTFYASYNEIVDISAFLSELLEGYDVNPYSYIPDEMQPDYSANLVDTNHLVTDYASFVNTSSIRSNGFGEQWQMVIDNLQQSTVFFNTLSVVEGVTATAVAAFNNYLDNNPGDTAQHNFMNGIYSVTISYDGSEIYFVLDYTANIPVLGSQAVQIAMSMDVKTKVKNVRIQIGDANALRYTVEDNAYTFAIKYLGVRRAQFTVERSQNGDVEGHINEYLTVNSVGIKSAADFYINDDYISVVGNKAGGLVGFTGFISELYNADTGRMAGYEVRETLSSITYNTLWFDLNRLSGISTIKYTEETDSTPAAFYVNGFSEAWEAKKVGLTGGLKAASRRFDIEFRKQYFYSYNEAEDIYEKLEVSVPMLFIQEEYYNELINDVRTTNNVTLSVILPTADLEKLQSDYDTLIDIFITYKDDVTEQIILNFIGNKKTFN